jgi:hypothetical protein
LCCCSQYGYDKYGKYDDKYGKYDDKYGKYDDKYGKYDDKYGKYDDKVRLSFCPPPVLLSTGS